MFKLIYICIYYDFIMNYRSCYVVSVLLAAVCGERRFPAGFKFGAATASYQVEGAWNVSGK